MITRRRMLGAAAALTGTTALTGAAALWPRSAVGSPNSTARRIALTNLHTDERLEVEYFRDGDYLPESLVALEVLLRDFRSGERHAIDPSLMDYLVAVADQVGVPPVFAVISGYRSPGTNERLREHSRGVSQHSLHMQGRAIDVRMGGVSCQSLAACAQDLKRGGVGFYRGSDFVHLDTGAFRTWRG